ncbi:hypothetical protein [Citreimonas salinaria]|uniref:hypothetical protein n=1 Tax=Citreimonas salinaria TaxID=321339 RepID=UPI000B7CEB93|nr:hypothetical protein [Citreimonas salinaria]
MAMAMSQPQAMAMAMRPGAMAMAMAADGESVPSFGDQVLSTWIELREIALLDQSERDTPSKYPYENLPLGLPPGREETSAEIRELHANSERCETTGCGNPKSGGRFQRTTLRTCCGP